MPVKHGQAGCAEQRKHISSVHASPIQLFFQPFDCSKFHLLKIIRNGSANPS